MKTSGGVVYPRAVPRKKVIHVLPQNASSNVRNLSRRQAGESFDSWRESLSPTSPPLASAETINALYERRQIDSDVRMRKSTSITSPIRPRPSSGGKRITDKLRPFLYDKVYTHHDQYSLINDASKKRDAALGKLIQQLHVAHNEHVQTFKGVAAADLFAPIANPASETICFARGYLATVGAAWHCAQVRSIEKLNEVAERLIEEEGYCEICANELLRYVGLMLSR